MIVFSGAKAEISVGFGQEVGFELWDWDPGFPGVQNDDFLGRSGAGVVFFKNNFACGVNLFYCFALINIYIHIFHSFRLMHATCALLRPTTSNSIETDKPDAYT